MRNRVLYCATIDQHVESFHLPYMKWFQDQGWEVHVAASGSLSLPYTDWKFDIPFERSPFRLNNVRAYRELKRIIGSGEYRIVHCHTPVGGALARLAAQQARKRGTRVLYTAHGFHFCRGASWMNWMLYYPAERWFARHTDCLITINPEDYSLATAHRFPAGRIEHVHGVGVDTDRFQPATRVRKREAREKLGFHENDFLMCYAAEFNTNKNQKFLIRALVLLKNQVPGAKLLLAGNGPLTEECRELSRSLDVEHMVRFLGYRSDMHEIWPACDIAVGSSLREGLPVNIMEAMASGLPVVATRNRGHVALIQHDRNGWIVDNDRVAEMAGCIGSLARNELLRKQFGEASRNIVLERFSVRQVLREKSRIYKFYMEEMERVQWAIR